MKTYVFAVAAVTAVATMIGATEVDARALENGMLPRMRALEEVKPATEAAETEQAVSGDAPARFEAMPDANAAKGEMEQYHGGWGCHPGAWNWPQCRWGGGWGCYPGSWHWPRCRWQYRCHPGSWYWPRCRYW